MQVMVKDISRILEAQYPPHLAEKWDNVGLQIGSSQSPVHKIMVSLDLDREILSQAIAQQVDMIITHHPLFFNPIRKIDYEQAQGDLIAGIIKNNINVYAAHTNLDAASRGINQYLAEKLELLDIQLLDQQHIEKLYKLVVYVPVSHEAAVREAIADMGAGHLGNYSHCSFRSSGTGTFLPRAGSNPYIGEPGKLQEVEELRLETIVPQNILEAVISRMKAAHPYEEVAYDLYPLQNQGQSFSLGRIGKLADPVSLQEFCTHVKDRLQLDNLRVVGNWQDNVQKIAIVSGAGASFMSVAKAQGCDLLLTGDLKYHEARDAEAMDLAVIDAGHQGSEQLMAVLVADLLQESCQKLGYDIDISATFAVECIKTI